MTSQPITSNESLQCTIPSFTRTDLWFCDGNIILVAGTFGLVAGSFGFKVHQGQLKRHSEVFDGLFGHLPQPSEQEIVDGCLCVTMHDAPDDLYYFLNALYDGIYFSHPRPESFARLAAVLRLSTKYFVPHLRQQAEQRLALDWPCTLEGWDAREAEALSKGSYSPRQYTPHPVLIIELALELGLSHLLPSAFYDLSRYGPSKIMQGTTGIKSVLVPMQSPPLPVRLSNDLLVRTLRGRELAQQFLITFLVSHVENRTPSVNCLYRQPRPSLTKAHPCAQAFKQSYVDIFRCIGGVAIGRDADPLYTLVQAMERLTRPEVLEGDRARALMCDMCKLELLDDCANGRLAAWANIPSWFGLANESKEGGWGSKMGDDDSSTV